MPSKSIKIVHVLEGFVGGLRTYVCTVLPGLVQAGFDVTLICSLARSCPDAPVLISTLEDRGVKVHIIPMYRQINLFRDIRSLAIILCLLAKNNFDVIHTHCSKAGALGRMAAALTGKDAIVHSPHCFAFLRCNSKFKGRLYCVLEKLLGRLTSRLVAVSRSEAAVVEGSGIVPSRKCVVVNNGLPVSHSLSNGTVSVKDYIRKVSLGFDRNMRVVLTACRLVEYKGIFRFIRAAKISRAHNAVFLIVGEGKLKTSIEKFIRENRLSNKVKFLGYISDMEQMYAISDVVALCSDAEAQPYVLLEAMRAKCAVVATSVIGNRELVSHGKTGFLAEPTPSSIATSIDKMLTDEKKRSECVKNAYAYFCKHHMLEKQILELVETYKSCVRSGQEQHAAAKASTR